MRSCTGAFAFFDRSAGIAMLYEPGILLPKPPPVYSLMSTILSCASAGGIPTPRATAATVCTVLCVRAVHVQLAVLPVGHRRPRLERLMARRLRDERFVEDQIRGLHDRVDVAERPLVGGLAHWQLAVLRGSEVLVRPLDLGDPRPGRRGTRGGAAASRSTGTSATRRRRILSNGRSSRTGRTCAGRGVRRGIR